MRLIATLIARRQRFITRAIRSDFVPYCGNVAHKFNYVMCFPGMTVPIGVLLPLSTIIISAEHRTVKDHMNALGRLKCKKK